MMKKVLIIDDEEKLRSLLARIISYEGFEVHVAGDCRTALKKIGLTDIDVVLCDVKLPDGNGIEFSRELKSRYPLLEIILLTAYGNIPDGVQAIKNGAFDYITKGDDNNKVIPLLYRALEKVDLAKKILHLEKQLGETYSFGNIIGKSQSILKAVDLAKKVSATTTTVLLTGETGTGKEVFAKAIHHASPRKNKAFIAINCAAISHELLESEFFGHKAGSFSGAVKDRKGLFAEANHGTIFLDEIGELALDLQTKLLRVIETGEFFRVGESQPVSVDVRIIAATNRNLLLDTESGAFREDLYYRISVFQISLPPLRERPDDIELFAHHFMQLFASKINSRITGIAPAFISALKLHPWKGNIRELRNIIERCVILANGTELTPDLLPPNLRHPSADLENFKSPSGYSMADAEKAHIQKVLLSVNGNKTKTAELLGIALTTLYRKLAEYQLK